MPCNLSYQSNFSSKLIGSIFQFDNAKLSAASPICDFPSHICEQQQLFKEGECNSPLQSYYRANGRGAPWSV